MTQTWWLSFCDLDRPTGQQFLGVAIVDVDETDRAEGQRIATVIRASHGLPPLTDPHDQWMAAAIQKSHRTRCNPGGEVLAFRIDDRGRADEIAAVPHHQLLTRPELEALGLPADEGDDA